MLGAQHRAGRPPCCNDAGAVCSGGCQPAAQCACWAHVDGVVACQQCVMYIEPSGVVGAGAARADRPWRPSVGSHFNRQRGCGRHPAPGPFCRRGTPGAQSTAPQALYSSERCIDVRKPLNRACFCERHRRRGSGHFCTTQGARPAFFPAAARAAMPTYNFKSMQVVPGSKDFIDIVLSKTQRQTPTVVHNGWSIQRIRQFYMRKVGGGARRRRRHDCSRGRIARHAKQEPCVQAPLLLLLRAVLPAPVHHAAGQVHGLQLARQADPDPERLPQGGGHSPLLQRPAECAVRQGPLQAGTGAAAHGPQPDRQAGAGWVWRQEPGGAAMAGGGCHGCWRHGSEFAGCEAGSLLSPPWPCRLHPPAEVWRQPVPLQATETRCHGGCCRGRGGAAAAALLSARLRRAAGAPSQPAL